MVNRGCPLGASMVNDERLASYTNKATQGVVSHWSSRQTHPNQPPNRKGDSGGSQAKEHLACAGKPNGAARKEGDRSANDKKANNAERNAQHNRRQSAQKEKGDDWNNGPPTFLKSHPC
jgi:hypothetical protein